MLCNQSYQPKNKKNLLVSLNQRQEVLINNMADRFRFW